METQEQPGAGTVESAPALFAPDTPATATPETAAPSAESSGESQGLLGTDAEGTEGLTAEELEEIEHEGKKAKVPKEFKDAFLRHKDYTQKTQDHADRVRSAEAQYAAREQQAQLREATLQESAQLIAIDQRLKQFEQVNWREAIQQNPSGAQELQVEMMNLRDARARLAQGIAQKQQAMTFQQQQITARRLEEGRRELERDIKGWSPELATKLMQTAKAYGFQDAEVAQVTDPRTIKLLHDAYQHRQSVAKQSVKPPVAPLPKPVTKVNGGSATNTKALSDLNEEEWAAKRQERRQANRR